FGKGVAGGEEICGAASGAVMALSLLAPHTTVDSAWEKQRIYGLSKKLQAKFRERFTELRCADLLASNLELDDRFPVAGRLGLTKPCEVFIATAVELVEELKEQIPTL
ncbi:MAG: C-GCAxxG-C-C family protein, partial [Oscillospiraceae bacterium]